MIPSGRTGEFHEGATVFGSAIAFVLKQAEDGAPNGEVCRRRAAGIKSSCRSAESQRRRADRSPKAGLQGFETILENNRREFRLDPADHAMPTCQPIRSRNRLIERYCIADPRPRSTFWRRNAENSQHGPWTSFRCRAPQFK